VISALDVAIADTDTRFSGPVDLGRVDLGPVVRGEQPPARPSIVWRDDGNGLFYPGALHDLHGEPGTAKTWLVLHAGAETLRTGGAFAFLDYEGTAQTFVERLRCLKVRGDVIADESRVAYHNLPGKTNPQTVAALGEQFTDMGVTFVGLDAMLPALIRNGYDDNSNADVAAFYETFARPLTVNGAALVCIDHMTKDSTTRVRGARGAGAKLQLVDVSYSVKTVKAFSRDLAGSVKLSCAKDRFGTFSIGEPVAEVHVVPNLDMVGIDLRAPEPRDPTAPFRPTHIMESVSRALEEHGELNTRALRTAANGRTEIQPLAVELLINEGYVTRVQEGREVRYRSVRPFRADENSQP
jgi:hypothetical protein